MNTEFDVLVVGGGLVGAALVTALKHSRLRLGLVEARQFLANTDPDYNERSVALGEGSRRILAALGLWSQMLARAQAINAVHISERGRFGVTRLRAQQLRLPALGYVALNRDLGAAFAGPLASQANLQLLAPAKLQCFEQCPDHVRVSVLLDGVQQEISTRLLVAADGTQSAIRQSLGLETRVDDYGQVALIANVTPGRPHQGWAYERFTPQGPVALLPLPENRCALVWTQTPAQAAATLALDDAAFLQSLQDWFGLRLGHFIKAGRRETYPLALTVAQQLSFKRGVVIGNAAHTLHPIAGQGLNLALRDVADLADCLAHAEDPGAADVLQAYAGLRQPDITRTVAYTDGLLRLFTNPAPLLSHCRGASLALLDRIAPARNAMARQGMGLTHSTSRLARGLSLHGEGA